MNNLILYNVKRYYYYLQVVGDDCNHVWQCWKCGWSAIIYTTIGSGVCPPRMASMAPSESPAEAADRYGSDLYTRPGWVDADVALTQLDQVCYMFVFIIMYFMLFYKLVIICVRRTVIWCAKHIMYIYVVIFLCHL